MKILIFTVFIILSCGRKSDPITASRAHLNNDPCINNACGDRRDDKGHTSGSASPGATGSESMTGNSEATTGSSEADTGSNETTTGSGAPGGNDGDTGSTAATGSSHGDSGNGEEDENIDLEAENVLKPLLQKAFETNPNSSYSYFAPTIYDLNQIIEDQISALKKDEAVAQLFADVDLTTTAALNIYDIATYHYYSDLFGGNGQLSDPGIDAAFKPVIDLFPLPMRARKMNQNQLAMIAACLRFAELITSNPNLTLDQFVFDTQHIFYDLIGLITMPKSYQTNMGNVSATNLISFISLRTKYDLALMDRLLMFLGYVKKIAELKLDATKLSFLTQQNLAKLEAGVNRLLKSFLPIPVQYSQLIFMTAFAKSYLEISSTQNLSAAERATKLLPHILKGAALLGALKHRALFPTQTSNTQRALDQGIQKVIAAQMKVINSLLEKIPEYVPEKVDDATLVEVKKLPTLASHVANFQGLQIYPEQYTANDYGSYREPLNRLGWQFVVQQLFYDKNDPQSSQQLMSIILWVAKVCMNDSYLAYLYYQATFVNPIENRKEINFLLWLRKNRIYLLEPLTHIVFDADIMMNEIIYERFTRIARQTEQWRKTYGENSFYKEYVHIAPKFDAQNKANIGYVMQFYTRLKQGIVHSFGDDF